MRGAGVTSPPLTRKWLRGQGYRIHIPGWTLEEFLRLAPENQRWEFVRGEVTAHTEPRRTRRPGSKNFLCVLRASV